MTFFSSQAWSDTSFWEHLSLQIDFWPGNWTQDGQNRIAIIEPTRPSSLLTSAPFHFSGYFWYQCLCSIFQWFRQPFIQLYILDILCKLNQLKMKDANEWKLFSSAIFSLCFENVVYSIFGSLPSALIFFFSQFYIVSGTLLVGVFNVSSFLQVAIITNQW